MGVTRNADLTCNKEWICEHRWRPIYGMVKFRNVAGDEPMTHWWDNGNNAIAFSRGNKAFIVINNEDSPVDHTFQTGLPAGHYCDVISGVLQGIYQRVDHALSTIYMLNLGGKCTGKTITVGNDGTAHITVDNKTDDPLVAIHIKAKL